ncbi:MAG: hypothetical protein R2911_34180 [Caldilineaceae bacterium]
MTVDGQLVCVGSDRFMALEGIAIPTTISAQQQLGHEEGYSLVFVAINATLRGPSNYGPPFAQKLAGSSVHYGSGALRWRSSLVIIAAYENAGPPTWYRAIFCRNIAGK